MRRARARMVEVLPVPGGPYRSRCGRRLESTNLLMVARMSWWPSTSSRDSGRYFSILQRDLRQWLDISKERYSFVCFYKEKRQF